MTVVQSKGSPNRGKFTYTCTFCGVEYVTTQNKEDAKTHCCQKKKCLLDQERIRKAEKRSLVNLEDWDEVIERFQPGETIAEFTGVISGGRFTAAGGAELKLVVGIEQKYQLIDATDYTGMIVKCVLSRPEKEDVDDSGSE